MALPILNNADTNNDISILTEMNVSGFASLENILVNIQNILKDQYNSDLKLREELRASAEEARREALNNPGDPAGDPDPKPEKPSTSDKKSGRLGLGDLLAIPAIIGLVASLTGLDTVINTAKLPGRIDKLAKLIKPTSDIFGIAKLSSLFSATGSLAKIGNTFRSLTDLFKEGGKFANVAAKLSKTFQPLLKILKLGARGFLAPVLAIFDFVSGFIKGFSGPEGSFIKGLFFGLTEVFKGFVTYPLDLIKSGISWLLGKLGFKVAEDALDSFTFSGGVDRFVEAITDDPLGMIAKIAMLPFDIIKGGISWVLGKLGFKGGVEVLDNFSFADTFGSLLKGDFQIMDKVKKFFSDIGKGIKSLFNLIPSLDDIKKGIISVIPTSILKVARASGYLDEDTENLITLKEKQEDLDEKEARVKELDNKIKVIESKPKSKLTKNDKRNLPKFKKEKEKLESEMDDANAELRGAQRDVKIDEDAKKDERSNEEILREARKEKRDIANLEKRIKMNERYIAGVPGAKKTVIIDGTEVTSEQDKKVFAQMDIDADKAEIERLKKSRVEKSKVLSARGQIEYRQEQKSKYSQAEEEIIEQLSQTEKGYSRAIGESRYRQMSQAKKDSLIKSKTGDVEKSLRQIVIGGQATGVALDAGGRAAREAANRNPQVNVVSAPQTDASTTVNNQTTSVAPGAAMARNPDSSFRMGTFNIL